MALRLLQIGVSCRKRLSEVANCLPVLALAGDDEVARVVSGALDKRLNTGCISASREHQTADKTVASQVAALAAKLYESSENGAGVVREVPLHSVDNVWRNVHGFQLLGTRSDA